MPVPISTDTPRKKKKARTSKVDSPEPVGLFQTKEVQTNVPHKLDHLHQLRQKQEELEDKLRQLNKVQKRQQENARRAAALLQERRSALLEVERLVVLAQRQQQVEISRRAAAILQAEQTFPTPLYSNHVQDVGTLTAADEILQNASFLRQAPSVPMLDEPFSPTELALAAIDLRRRCRLIALGGGLRNNPLLLDAATTELFAAGLNDSVSTMQHPNLPY
jgi:hypothetical protein